MSKTDKLKEIVYTTTGYNVDAKSRKSHNVFSRMIYSKILNEQGLGPSAISRTLGRDHSTIIHYLDGFAALCMSKPYVREWYNSARSRFKLSSSNLDSMTKNEAIDNYIKLTICISEVLAVLNSYRDQMSEEAANELSMAISKADEFVLRPQSYTAKTCCSKCGSTNINTDMKSKRFCLSCGAIM